jgi:hypothetical protein
VRPGRLSYFTPIHENSVVTWSVITRLPVSPHVTAGAAARLVERLVEHVRPLAMTSALDRKAIRRCAERGARSGAIFNALHLAAAEVSRADVFVTLNPGDFERLASERGPRIIVPPDPPRVTAR